MVFKFDLFLDWKAPNPLRNNETKQNKTEPNQTKQNQTKQNKTKQNNIDTLYIQTDRTCSQLSNKPKIAVIDWLSTSWEDSLQTPKDPWLMSNKSTPIA